MESEFLPAITFLRNPEYPLDTSKMTSVRSYLSSIKKNSIAAQDGAKAKKAWCYETACDVIMHYLDAFNKLRQGEHYKAWCALERTELSIKWLKPHIWIIWFPRIDSPLDELGISFIEKMVSRLQSLFPYKYFGSPEMVIDERRCSVCNEIISILKPCDHHTGEIYDGEMCTTVVTKVRFAGLALVKNPVQKYSVFFASTENDSEQKDSYDYTMLSWLMTHWRSPFGGWSYTKTTERHPHSKYPDVQDNDPCPCESGADYRVCCKHQAGILRPHFQFSFDEEPILPPGISYFY